MNALIFDPSSTATGWALMPLSGVNRPVCSGLLKRPVGWGLNLRLGGLQHDVALLLKEFEGQYDRIVIETPGVAHGEWTEKRSNSAPSYAMAVGIVIAEAWRTEAVVITVAADFWTKMGTRRCVPKDRRLAGLVYSGAYDGQNDPGGDRGDAIGLGGWFTMRYGSVLARECPLSLPETKTTRHWPAVNVGVDGPIPVGARWNPDPR